MKNPHAVVLGKKGGKARAKNLTDKERSEGARKAILARWERYYEAKRGDSKKSG